MKTVKKSLFKSGLAVLLTLTVVVSCLSFSALFASAANEDEIPATFDNPVIKTDADGNTFFSADPSVRVFDGKLYMYPSHDVFPASRCDFMDNYHVFSSTNGQDWKDEGEILSAATVGWGAEKGFMWAPDCEKIGDKYYFFYPHKYTRYEKNDLNINDDQRTNVWQTGVAVSDTPVGPFKDLGPIEGTQGLGLIDPNVLVDGDKAYLYWGGSQTLFAAEININGENVTISNKREITDQIQQFHEGSWCFKKDGKYYMTYASGYGGNGEVLAYATGDTPFGPFTFKGVMLNPAKESNMDTSHGCVVEYKGEWLVFYHNMALSGFECLRSVCVDRLTFNSDGSINAVDPAPNTAPPLNKNEPTGDGVKKYPINKNDWTLGNTVNPNELPGFNESDPNNVFVANMHYTGAYYETKIIDGGEKGGKARLHFRYSANTDYAAICVAINGVSFDPAPAAPNGAWENFTNYTSTTVKLQPGMNTLRITGGYGGVNVSAVYVEMLAEEIEEPSTEPTTEPTTEPSNPVDLTISEVIVNPDSITAGDEITFMATVRNMGGATVKAGTVVNFFIDSQPVGTGVINKDIASGEYAVATSTGTIKSFKGTHTVAAVVNFDKSATESNYDNNLLRQKFAVND